jgi:phthiocerol/phenolphthiocerol synthesis type-I polyketide synthase A
MTAPAPDRRAIITEALRKIDDLTARLAIAEKATTEPIAVVGIGCRLPGGVTNTDEFWTLLTEGASGVVRVPADRWDADALYSEDHTVPGTICNRVGGFLTSWQPDEFDAEFFNIAPREAAAIDPQQRLLLEVTWEALENAGINPQSIKGTQTGVFIGLTTNDYYHSVASKLRLEQIDAYIPFGNAPNFAAGRLSYFLGARGPAVVMDTACSSSLVSIHLACESLRRRESDAALAAGVNLILSPENSIGCSRFGMLSPDGIIKTFDADANGYVRSEGCGVVVLKRLEDAQRDGDRILAVVRGSAVNQDGASSGQTVPNGPAQQALMRQALHSARLAPSDVDYVEAHGTGTGLGDPIELDALAEVYGDRGGSAPLVLGSVKTNLGHLESAAGVTGFIKAVLSVAHGHIPRQLNFTRLTPLAGPGAAKFVIAAEPLDWPQVDRPRRAAVSSFGVSGTNAHVIVEQAPAVESAAHEPEPAVSTLVVSGRSPQRIAATAQRLADWLDDTQATGAARLSEVAHTLNHHRARYPLFATVAATDRQQAVEGLRGLAGGYPAPGVVGPHSGQCRPGTVFVYSGQGSQWAGMGRRLLAEESAFAAAVEELEPSFVEQVGFSLREVLASGEPVVGIARIQPVLVGVQLALTALWRSYGVHPDAVIGHSMGEVTAAVVAGALTPAEGLTVIATRSRLMSRLSGQGAMALLELRPEAAGEVLADYPDVAVAVEASPRQVVIAGPPDQVDAVIAVVSAQDRLARRVEVDVASHHAIIDPVLDDLRTELAGLNPQRPRIPVFVTTGGRERSDSGIGPGGHERSESGMGPGDRGADAVFDADHWVANLRNPVRFTQAVAAAGAKHGTFIEVSPHPILTYAVDDTLTDVHHHTVATLTRDGDDTLTFHTNLNATHTVRTPETEHHHVAHVPLPVTPWHHTRHWISAPPPPRQAGASSPAPGTVLGAHMPVAGAMSGHLWQACLEPNSKPYNGFRRLAGAEIVPASVLIATLARAVVESGAAAVEDVTFDSPLTLDQPRLVQVYTDGESVSISSAPDGDAAGQHWIRNVNARMSSRAAVDMAEPAADGAAAPDPSSIDELHIGWRIEGRAFDWSVDSHEAVPGRLRADIVAADSPDITAALLDAAMDLARLAGAPNAGLLLPIGAETIRFAGNVPSTARGVVEIRRRGGGEDDLVVDVAIRTADQQAIVDIRGLRYKAVQSDAALAPAADPDAVAHVVNWQPWEPEAGSRGPGSLAILGNDAAARALRDRLGDLGYPQADPADARYIVYVADTETAEADVDVATRLICDVGGIVTRLVDRDPRNPGTLWIVTRGVREAVSESARRQSCLWALGGVIGAEQPQVWGGLLDVGPDDDLADCAAVLSEILPATAKSTVLLRDGLLTAAVVAPLTGTTARQPLRCRPDAAYLVTGGLGDLGLMTANWLADRGARHLILVGRSGLPPRAGDNDGADPATRRRMAAISALERRGVTVQTAAIDVGSADDVSALIAHREADHAAPIRGVVHGAGLAEGQLLTDLEPDRVRRTVWPKIAGAQVLHDAFPPGRLDFLYLIASAGTVFGVPGQAAYAGGNAYLDALARARHRQGDNTVSLDWVAWEGLGLGKDAQLVVSELERVGSRPINPAEASAAWEYVTRYDVAQVVMAPMQTAAAADQGEQAALPSMDWSALTPEEMQAELRSGVRAIVAGELRIPEDQIELDRPFAEMGLNSVMAISIRRRLEQFVGVELSATMLFNHPTIESFSTYLAVRLAPEQAAGADDHDVDDDTAGSLLDSLFDTVESTAEGIL